MQTPKQKEDPYILVEFNGTRKAILKEKLPEARKMETQMQEAARRAGYPEQEIKDMFTLRIVKE